MKKVFLLLCLVLVSSALFGQEDPFAIDEEDFFSDEEIITDVAEIEDHTTASVLNEESVTFSGDISAKIGYSLSRDFIDGDGSWEENPYTLLTFSNLMLDIRLKEGIKSFANLSVGYLPGGALVPTRVGVDTNADYIPDSEEIHLVEEFLILDLKEFFIDVNLNWKAYFRIGKQVLNWGRGYLWNPSDLVNIQQRSFNDMEALRTGSSGVKMHIPFGTAFNFYSYLNFTEIDNLTDIALSGKAEALLGNTEFSFSTWWKSGFKPVLGMDFSSRVFGLDLWGEASLTAGEDLSRMSTLGVVSPLENWLLRACLGLSRSFDMGDIQDRIMIVGEVYYNQAGYEKDMFESPVSALFGLTSYEAMNYGIFYASVFTTINELFGNKELSGSLNALGNLTDLSFVLRSGLSYSPVDNFSLGFTLITPVGEENREFTVSLAPVSAELNMGLRF